MRNDGGTAGSSQHADLPEHRGPVPRHRGRAARASGRFALAAVFALGAAAGPALAAQAAPAGAEGRLVWDRLAECEAGGNWQANTGNGYYGGLQFDARTWRAYEGDRFAGYAHNASREQQISVGEAVRADRGGYGAWPACSRKLGLPR
ncbi:hypothetical protein GCM10027174_38710 [Salinifilum aidingensis]